LKINGSDYMSTYTNVVCYGVKIYDILDIYTKFFKEDLDALDILDKNKQKLLKKILKADKLDYHTGFLCTVGNNNNKISLLEKTNADKSDPNIYFNKLILFNGAIHAFFLIKKMSDIDAERQNVHNDPTLSRSEIAHTIKSLQENLLELVNNIGNIILDLVNYIFDNYLNTQHYTNCVNDNDDNNHVFTEPRCLLSILKEFHPDEQVYHRIKNIIKQSNIDNIIFRKLNNFLGKQSSTIRIENFDKIYLWEWDTKNDIIDICSLVSAIMLFKNLKHRHLKYTYSPCDCRLCKSSKKVKVTGRRIKNIKFTDEHFTDDTVENFDFWADCYQDTE